MYSFLKTGCSEIYDFQEMFINNVSISYQGNEATLIFQINSGMHPAKRTRTAPERLEAGSKHQLISVRKQKSSDKKKQREYKRNLKLKKEDDKEGNDGKQLDQCCGIPKGAVFKWSVFNDKIASVDTAYSHKQEQRVKCEACGKALASDETLDEHVVSVHLTSEGLCNICGGDSEDFIEHFKVHLKSCNKVIELATLDTIKKENLYGDDNQNFNNYTESDLVVKDENEEEDS
jgi:hypothetical protein